jgi:hypothetical protein
VQALQKHTGNIELLMALASYYQQPHTKAQESDTNPHPDLFLSLPATP